MVLIAKYVAEDGVLVLSRVLDKTHCDTRNRVLHWNTGIHECERACADSSHGRRAVRLQYLAYKAHGVWEVGRYLSLQTTPCEMAMANLTTAYATLGLSLAGTERWEVIVKEEPLVASVENIVNELLVELGTKRTCREALCLATCEDRASVRHWQRRHLAPDRTYVSGLTSVEADALVEDATAHGVALHVGIVSHGLGMLLLKLVGCKVGMCLVILGKEVGDNLLESLLTLLLGQGSLGGLVCWSIQLVLNLLAQLLVVHLVVVSSLHVGAELLGQLLLEEAHGLDSLGGSLERADEVLL